MAVRPRRSDGQAMVEFALLAFVLVLLIFALFDVGRAIYAYNALSNAAREGARIAIIDQGPASGGVSLAAQDAANQATSLGRSGSVQVHIRRTMILTPSSGTRTAKIGGGGAALRLRGISRRSPSLLTSTMCDGTPPTIASKRLTGLRMDRRSGRLSITAICTMHTSRV